ncbi:MAG TPA: molybdate ABC transporter substrate-binding protein [Egibacteraceae bacterium]|nr:molybdate ABC transporter substrate-binding protein [Egibacteraceae bacterium]
MPGVPVAAMARRLLPVLRPLLLAMALTLVVSACAGATGSDDTPDGEVVVFAAASLAEGFTAVGEAFRGKHPTVGVRFSFAGSDTLSRQVVEGAPADVLASADPVQMAAVEAAGSLAAPPSVFARNVLAIAVEPGNPLGISGLADLGEPGLLLALAGEEVPAGAYARSALEAAGVTVRPATREPDVRAAMSKVVLGEADAAIVYASDVAAAAGRVAGVAIPPEHNVSAAYLIARLDGAPNPRGARAFVDFVLGAEARDILAEHGFLRP